VVRSNIRITKLKQKRLHSLLLPALALCVGSLPATATTVLFSDLGPGNSYSSNHAFPIYGAGNPFDGYVSVTQAALFTVAGTDSLPVTEIDLPVSNIDFPNTFDASIWTDSGGQPGVQLDSWLNLSTTLSGYTCCGVVSITGISGLNLTGGQEYFMVLGPASLTDTSNNVWNLNDQGVYGLNLYSNDGGATWAVENSYYPEFAFDITSPEPGSLLLFGTGLIAILAVRRPKSNR